MNKILFILLLISLKPCVAQDAKDSKKNVAIFVHPGVQLLDFTGPSEVFTDAGYNVYAVAASDSVIVSQRFLKIKPNYTIYNCPPPDIVVLPGGATKIPMSDPKVVEWVKKSAEHSIMLSVCTGALLLAEAGLLNDKTATTHYCCQDDLAKYSSVTVVRGKRFVDNGNIITTEGISAGIDGSLYLVSKLKGKEAAQKTAHYMMYDWKPDNLDVLIVQK